MPARMSDAQLLGYLREKAEYDRERGAFVWRVTEGRKRAGADAGSADAHGYRGVRILGCWYRLHHLVWLVEHGGWPDRAIDHANGDRADNRIVNLRLAEPYENSRNQRKHRDGQSKFKGVTRDRRRHKWMAQIWTGRHSFLGYFEHEIDAARAYDCAARKHYGEFARINGV